MLSSLLAADKLIYELIHNLGANNSIGVFLPLFSLFGETLLWLGVVAFLFFKKERKISLLLLIGLIIDLAIVSVLKIAVPRARPLGVGLDSFPSGHASKAFLGWVMLSHEFPSYTFILYALTILTLISRIYTGAHYPSDVAVGAIIGFSVGKFVWMQKEKFYAVFDKFRIF